MHWLMASNLLMYLQTTCKYVAFKFSFRVVKKILTQPKKLPNVTQYLRCCFGGNIE